MDTSILLLAPLCLCSKMLEKQIYLFYLRVLIKLYSNVVDKLLR